jgi:lysophospholipase L1-like esterase
MLGDSLTQLSFDGWGSMLANVYQRRADVLNRGYAGYNTRFYLQYVMPNVLQNDYNNKEQASLTLIFFGANDAALVDIDPHHHVPLQEYKDNLIQMVQQIRTRQSSAGPDDDFNVNDISRHKILLMTPPPVDHNQRLAYQKQRFGTKATGVLERTLEHTGLYAAACQQVADLLHVPCLNLYTDMLEQRSLFLSDGLHFSAKGHSFVGQRLLQAIQEHFADDWHVTADPTTGQWCNSGSTCVGLTSQGPYHDEIVVATHSSES